MLGTILVPRWIQASLTKSLARSVSPLSLTRRSSTKGASAREEEALKEPRRARVPRRKHMLEPRRKLQHNTRRTASKHGVFQQCGAVDAHCALAMQSRSSGMSWSNLNFAKFYQTLFSPMAWSLFAHRHQVRAWGKWQPTDVLLARITTTAWACLTTSVYV